MKSGTAGKQEVPTLEENTLYQNLCILGIAPPTRGDGVDLNRTSFRRTNNKTVEYVLYRLHYIIEGKPRTTKEFKGIWPVADKLMATPFYQKIGDWLSELKKNSKIDPAVILPVSALKTNTSPRLVLLLLELSSLALYYDLEAICPGASQQLMLPPPQASIPEPSLFGPPSSTSGLPAPGPGEMAAVLPMEARCALQVARTKGACRACVGVVEEGAAVCAALEERCAALKERYYEEHKRQRDIAESLARAAASQALLDGDDPMGGDLTAAGQGPLQLSAHQAAALAELTHMLRGLDTHLGVHKELAVVLRPDCEAAAAAEAGVGAAAGGRAGVGGGGGEGPSPAGVGPQAGHSRGQVLHPHQVDGAALAAEAAAVATQGAGAGAGGGGRQQQQHHPFRPDQLLAAFSAFSQVLGAVAPNLTQLAMAGEDAGPPPLLQPPTRPTSHAAHVLHALQVHTQGAQQIEALDAQLVQCLAAYGTTLPTLKQQLRAHRIPGYAPKEGEGDDHEHGMDPASSACPPDDDLCVPFPSALGAHLALPPAARPAASTASGFGLGSLPAGPALSTGGASSMGAAGAAASAGGGVEVSSDVAALQARLRNLGLTTSALSYTPPGSNGSTQRTASAGPGPGMGQGQGPVAVGTTAASPPPSAYRTASGGGGAGAGSPYGMQLPFAYTSPSNLPPAGGLQAQVASWRSPVPSARSPLSPTVHARPYAPDSSSPADHLAALRAATSASPIHHHQHNPYRSASSAGGSSTGAYPGLQLPPPLVSSTFAQLSSPPGGGSGAFGGAGAAMVSPGASRSGLSTFGSGGGSAAGAGGGAAQTVRGGDLNSWLASVGVTGVNAAPGPTLATTGSGSLAAAAAPSSSSLTSSSPMGGLTLTPVPVLGLAAITAVPTAGLGGAAAGVAPAMGSTEPSPQPGFLNLTPFPGLGEVGPRADAGAGTAGEATPAAFGAVGGFAANGFGVPAAAAPAAGGLGGFGGFAAQQQQPGPARGFGAVGPLATPPPLPTPARTPTMQQGRVDLSSLLLDDTPLPFGGAAGAGRSGAWAGAGEGGFGGFGAAVGDGAEGMDMTPVGFGVGGGGREDAAPMGASGPGAGAGVGLSFGDVEGAGEVGDAEAGADFALLAAEGEMMSWRLVGGSAGGAAGEQGQGEAASEADPGRRSWGSGGGAPPAGAPPARGEEATLKASGHVRAAARSPGAAGRKSHHSSPRRPGYVDVGAAAVAAAAAGQDDVRAGVRDTSRPAHSAFASPHSRSSPQQQGLKARGPEGSPLASLHGAGSPGGMALGAEEQGWGAGYGNTDGDAMMISPMPAPGRGYAPAWQQQQQPSPQLQQQGASGGRDRGSFGGGGAVGLAAAAGSMQGQGQSQGQGGGSTFTSLEAPQLSLEQLKARMQRVCMG